MGYENVYREGGQDGWLTSAVTRPAMIENLAAVLIEKPELFQSPRLLGELQDVCEACGWACGGGGWERMTIA